MHITRNVFAMVARHASSIVAASASASLVWGIQSLGIFQNVGLDLVWPFYGMAGMLQLLAVAEYLTNRR